MVGDALLGPIAAVGIPLGLIVYVLLWPEKVQKVAGWLWRGVALVKESAEKEAVSKTVEGTVNDARSRILKRAPEGFPEIVAGRLELKWTTADEVKAVLEDDKVVVFMRRSTHNDDNIAHALVAYVPRAVIEVGRRYTDKPTMRAADLILAKALLTAGGRRSALDSFYEQHVDPEIAAEPEMEQRLGDMDEIDLNGWLLRILLPELHELGRQLHPSHPDARVAADTMKFARWLGDLARRPPGDDSVPLAHLGSMIRVVVVLVANRQRLLEDGIEPYRKRAKSLIYSGDYDAVYLVARDAHIPAVEEIYQRLAKDGRVGEHWLWKYRLRRDFERRRLPRTHGVIACLRMRAPDGDLSDADEELPPVEVEIPEIIHV